MLKGNVYLSSKNGILNNKQVQKARILFPRTKLMGHIQR